VTEKSSTKSVQLTVTSTSEPPAQTYSKVDTETAAVIWHGNTTGAVPLVVCTAGIGMLVVSHTRLQGCGCFVAHQAPFWVTHGASEVLGGTCFAESCSVIAWYLSKVQGLGISASESQRGTGRRRQQCMHPAEHEFQTSSPG
jgi:hypothetical protein